MRRTVICISHETGAGGPALASAVAHRLGYRYVDEDILVRAARNEGLTVTELENAERRKSFFARVADSLGSGPVGLYDAPAYQIPGFEPVPSADDLLGHIRRSIADIAEEGEVVIVSHAASYALAARDDVLRVLVVASPDVRADRLAAENDLDQSAASRAIAEHDDARASYLKRVYGVKRESPIHYDLVVNTDRFEPGELAELVCSPSIST
jgi:cytidylate kinase